jgi:hypothetical protein
VYATLRQEDAYVYVGVGLHREILPSKRRGGSHDIFALTALYADLDFYDPIHKDRPRPCDQAEGREFLRTLRWAPTLVVQSGHGLQPWWKLREPLTDMAQATQLLAYWKHYIQGAAKTRGWKVDAVFDLARVMRVAGTRNYKRDPVVPVRILQYHPQADYHMSDLLEVLDAIPLDTLSEPCHDNASPERPPACLLEDEALLERMLGSASGEKIARLMAGALGDYDHDHSRADEALCCLLAFWSGNAAQMDRLFRGCRLMRPKWDEVHYSTGDTYGAHTIKKALEVVQQRYHPDEAPAGDEEDDGLEPERVAITLLTDLQAHPREVSPPASVPIIGHDTDASLGASASPRLEAMIAFGMEWLPQSPREFHEAAALWILSIIAARRVRIANGRRRAYTPLYIALVARSTFYAKTTAADIARDTIKDAGLGFLLAPNRATPQALHQSMSFKVRSDYHEMDYNTKFLEDKKLAFAAQRGWWYDEIGGLFQSMMDRGGHHAGFHSLLRDYYNCPDEDEDLTIYQGFTKVIKPYLAILGTMTIADLRP